MNDNKKFDKEIDELVNSFVGDKIYKFKEHKFSWSFFLFDILYLIYRKLYGFAVGWLLYSYIIFFFSDGKFFAKILFYLISKLFVSSVGNALYLTFVKNKMVHLKWNNSDKTQEELICIASKKGGTNKNIFIYIIIFIAAFFLTKIFINNL